MNNLMSQKRWFFSKQYLLIIHIYYLDTIIFIAKYQEKRKLSKKRGFQQAFVLFLVENRCCIVSIQSGVFLPF